MRGARSCGNHDSSMKHLKSITTFLAAGLLGAAGTAFASSALSARLPGDALMAAGFSLGFLILAISDYARRPQLLRLPVTVLRPALPVAALRPARAYGIRRQRAIIERVAG